ncbi:MAG: phosphoribosyl-AMP cyclohydrolase [Alphaproteobacteria bacterium]|jgi:phosphoribosyl-AMP cyclohydrolase|nr:phosphoribosyl-AMP cyclohydrolase [Alphaproteobacteria bacterium]
MSGIVYEPKVIEAIQKAVQFDDAGLVPVIAQAHDSGKVLMLAWMNKDALRLTLETGRVTYWSRSRGALWRKGDTSGQTQDLHDFRLDCDGDAVLLKVHQHGVACHTGRESCFFLSPDEHGLIAVDPVVVSPDTLYPGK